ncbi:TPR Domain containing protein [Metarhizium album ARSEF 1941]|uniref:TPR Domain containing protein n=1 Tax=Metarhizium album (strain ARSEF 1941) TaxID=1081103 RepID=A0A0B2X0M9_METAS|nr:TPR Domain containing protein [Metarhizium album ARSEF 1941]KHN99404.1 TPR Domain containing protein [Metarhizium album ARSEF 1941]
MHATAIASTSPLQRRCLAGFLSVQVKSRAAGLSLGAAATSAPHQTRWQSTSRGDEDRRRPQVSFRRFVGRALGTSLRNLAVAVSPRGVRTAYRDSPVATSMNIVLLALTLAVSAVAIRSYVVSFYNSEFSRYPEPVANTLRRAIYYTNYKPDPEMALKYYKKAMEQVKEVGLDPFSDEVLGIRIQVSFWLQKINSYKGSIDVLESVLQDCKKWVGVMEQSVADGNVNEAGRYVNGPTGSRPAGSVEVTAPPPKDGPAKTSSGTGGGGDDVGAEQDDEVETLWRKRQRLLAKAVGTAVKLGELYADEHVLRADKSHDHLVWAVETSLEEFRRRRIEGVRPGEQDWLSPPELGGMMESLGRDYERRSQFQLSVPLFFQALRLCESPCHRAVIMNNLAACFAQQPVFAPDTAQVPVGAAQAPDQGALPKTRKECLEAGLSWAQNAYAHSRDVHGEERTAECDEACAVALCNWGDVAAMLGQTDVARQKYRQCIEMSQEMAFVDGVRQAQDALARLTATPENKT